MISSLIRATSKAFDRIRNHSVQFTGLDWAMEPLLHGETFDRFTASRAEYGWYVAAVLFGRRVLVSYDRRTVAYRRIRRTNSRAI